jgi:Ca2+-binding EF-hand superfamily protein
MSLTALVALGLFACSSAVPGSESTGSTEQEVETGEPPAGAAPQGQPGAHRGPPTPEGLLEKLDADDNGVLERAEIPRFLEGADTNQDGRVTLEELRAHRENMRARHFARMDSNGDGSITQTEVGERRWKRLSAADADRNGSITRAELDQAHANGTLRPMRGHKGGFKRMDPARLVEKFDQNKNGTLEVSELPEHKRERLAAADTNQDQVLSADEIEAHFRAHRAHPRKHFGARPPAGVPAK